MAQKKDLKALERRITALQSDLFDLYRQRQELFGHTDYPTALRTATTTVRGSADDCYESLERRWSARGIIIPSQQELLPAIKSALIVSAQLAQALGTAPELFAIELIPPRKAYTDTQLRQDRLKQSHVRYADKRTDQIKVKSQTHWKIMVIYDGIDGLLMGSAQDILEEKGYVIADHDTRALGVREYAIYTLRHTTPRDQHNWVWLLKDSGSVVYSATFSGGAYRFVADDAAGLLGLGEREVFRPAVEIDV